MCMMNYLDPIKEKCGVEVQDIIYLQNITN